MPKHIYCTTFKDYNLGQVNLVESGLTDSSILKQWSCLTLELHYTEGTYN